jgi:hypothetical protein
MNMQNTLLNNTDTKALRNVVNAHNKDKGFTLRGVEKANNNAVAILADAVRETGNETLADILNGIAEFLPVWEENKDINNQDAPAFAKAACWATDRNKFIALDYGCVGTTSGSGCFLVEKATGYVWSIKAYGKKNRIVAVSMADLVRQYRESNETARAYYARIAERRAARLEV